MAGAGGDGGRRVDRPRLVLGVLLALLAAVLAPAALVAGWAHDQVNDTEAFVARYGPLGRDPRVQDAVATSLTEAVTGQLALGDNPFVESLVRRTVSEFAGSDAFEAAWTAGLRVAHGEFRALLTGEGERLQVVDGQVQVRLAPFADAVKQRLAQAGVPFVDRLPAVTGGIPVLQLDPRLMPAVQVAYQVLEFTAAWLGWLAAAVAVAAVWLWPHTRAALIGVAGAVALGVVVAWLVTAAVVRTLVAGLAPPFTVLAGTVAEATLSPLESPALALVVTGAVVAVLAALAAGRPPR